ncbi:MAG: DUF6339 family protein [Myxococcota bacterium]|nr:DUF6339 family protein [Myxococcota bacterium]
MKLQRLTRAGHVLLDETFLGTASAKLNPGPGQVEDLEVEISIDEVGPLLHAAMQEYGPGDGLLDAHVGIRLHRLLPLSRRIARERGAWHYLTSVAYPEFVRHRFRRETGGLWTRARFLGILQQNALARIWWVAELARDGDDYTLAEQLLSNSSFDPVFDRAFSWHPPMLRAFVKVLTNVGTGLVEQATKDLNHALSTIAVEVLDEAESERLVKDVVIRGGRPSRHSYPD